MTFKQCHILFEHELNRYVERKTHAYEFAYAIFVFQMCRMSVNKSYLMLIKQSLLKPTRFSISKTD